ncbi:MAG: AAA family ATPase [Desulfovibrio sp.]|jgi:predicted ATPase|nr:AAA family ATPase [Desulfovibrio sp.]
MFINGITLRNFLSYGGQQNPVSLGPLNIVIGPNGSGKSNLLEAIELIRNTPGMVNKPIREGGGIDEWLHKNDTDRLNSAEIRIIFDFPFDKKKNFLLYELSFSEYIQRFYIKSEIIGYPLKDVALGKIINEDDEPIQAVNSVYSGGAGYAKNSINGENNKRTSEVIKIDPEKSILAQRKDPKQYLEITYLAEEFDKIRIYRDWTFGRYAATRQPQKTDLPNHWLEPDASNIALVLNKLRRDYEAKGRLLDALRKLYDGIDDYDVRVEGGTVQVFFQEGRNVIPATRLSDGTLRYLSLLTILLHPTPPPLVCIEEPELGLHPDILPTVADLLKDASSRMQLIVTTHSDILVDAMTDMPEAVLVCEKTAEGSRLRRLDAEQLKPWLEKYRLGESCTPGKAGGLR